MTTKELLVEALLSQSNGGYITITNQQLLAFTNIIIECDQLEKLDAFVKAKGYDDVADFDYSVCEGHFDDGLYDDDIYKSEEAFKEHIMGYADIDKLFGDTPHKSER